MFENPRRGRQARNFTTNVPKIADRKSSSEQIFSENCRWVPLTTIGFPAKGCLRNERKNSIFMTCHYPDLSVSDWLKQISHAVRPIRSVDKGSDTSSVWNFCARSFALKPVLASQNVGCFQVKWILLLICRIHILFL